MKILHVVTLLSLVVSAPVIAQPKDDELSTVMQYLSTHNRIKDLRASAIKCTQEAQVMQRQLQQQGARQREWEQLKRSCQEELRNIDRIRSETFVSCVNDTGPGHAEFCYQYFVDS
jgi:hypothetical protein